MHSVNGGVFLSYRVKTPLAMDIHNTQYTDDSTLHDCIQIESRTESQNMLDVLDRSCRKWRMKINCNKTI